MNLYENIKNNLKENERITKLAEKRKTLKDDKLNMNESDNKNEILSKIFAYYPDISEEDEDFLNGLSYEDLIAEIKNRGWYDVLNEAEESENKDLDKVRDIANDFIEYLRKNQISAELLDYDYDEPYGTISYEIEWGDWKHDHLYSQKLAEEFFGGSGNAAIDSEVTEEDGSDTYSAKYDIGFDLDNYSNSQDEDKMNKTASTEPNYRGTEEDRINPNDKRPFAVFYKEQTSNSPYNIVKTEEQAKVLVEKLKEEGKDAWYERYDYDNSHTLSGKIRIGI